MKKLIIVIIIFLSFIPNIHAYSTSATSSILVELESGKIIHGKNINKQRGVASISKIMTAIIAIESGKLDEEVVISNLAEKSYGSAIYIKEGEKLTLKDLVYGLMLRSGNDAAIEISRFVSGSEEEFVKLMNKKAQELNMKNTIFNNPSGLDYNGGNISTAKDMSILMRYAMHNDIFKTITKTKQYKLSTNLNNYLWINKNKLLKQYKYTIGGKTGYTEKVGRTLVTAAKKNKMTLIAVTLNDGNDFLDHKNLYEEGFKEYKLYKILSRGKLNILNETYYSNVTFYLKKDFYYPLLDIEKNNIIIHIKLDKNKDFKENSIIGSLEVLLNDNILYEDNIYIKSNKIEKKWLK